ncbi:unnamed protein product, partial [Bodo saltans]
IFIFSFYLYLPKKCPRPKTIQSMAQPLNGPRMTNKTIDLLLDMETQQIVDQVPVQTLYAQDTAPSMYSVMNLITAEQDLLNNLNGGNSSRVEEMFNIIQVMSQDLLRAPENVSVVIQSIAILATEIEKVQGQLTNDMFRTVDKQLQQIRQQLKFYIPQPVMMPSISGKPQPQQTVVQQLQPPATPQQQSMPTPVPRTIDSDDFKSLQDVNSPIQDAQPPTPPQLDDEEEDLYSQDMLLAVVAEDDLSLTKTQKQILISIITSRGTAPLTDEQFAAFEEIAEIDNENIEYLMSGIYKFNNIQLNRIIDDKFEGDVKDEDDDVQMKQEPEDEPVPPPPAAIAAPPPPL